MFHVNKHLYYINYIIEKSACNFWLPQNLTTVLPQYPLGIDSRIPLQVPKSTDAQVPQVKWRSTKHTVSPLHPSVSNCRSKILFSMCGWLNQWMWNPGRWRADCIFLEKKSSCKWTKPVQTGVAQASTVNRAIWFNQALGASEHSHTIPIHPEMWKPLGLWKELVNHLFGEKAEFHGTGQIFYFFLNQFW